MQDSIGGTFLESVPPSEIELSDCFVLFRELLQVSLSFSCCSNFSAIFFLTGFGTIDRCWKEQPPGTFVSG